MPYAINVCDSYRPELQTPMQFMVGPVVPNRTRIRPNKNAIDTDAVLLECSDSQALAICEFMQKAAKDRGLLLRCYTQGPKGGWKEMKRI